MRIPNQRTSLNLQIPCHFLQNAEWCWWRTAISSRNGCEKLEEALEGLSDTTVLIFVEKNIDNRKKLSKLVAQLGTVAMFDAPDSEMLAVWLNGMFVEDQIAISGATLRYLIDRVGTSMNLLKNEADKLRSYAVEKEAYPKKTLTCFV